MRSTEQLKADGLVPCCYDNHTTTDASMSRGERRRAIRGSDRDVTFLSPRSPSAAPAPSGAGAPLCVASPLSRSRWGTSGRTRPPAGPARRRRRTHSARLPEAHTVRNVRQRSTDAYVLIEDINIHFRQIWQDCSCKCIATPQSAALHLMNIKRSKANKKSRELHSKHFIDPEDFIKLIPSGADGP